MADLGRTAGEVARGLTSLLHEHEGQIKRIRNEFRTKHKHTLTIGGVGLAASFLPALAPFLGAAAPVGVLAKYGWDKISERDALKRASRSLIGVLAKARRGGR